MTDLKIIKNDFKKINLEKALEYERENIVMLTITDLLILEEIFNGNSSMQKIKEKHKIYDWTMSKSVRKLSDEQVPQTRTLSLITKEKDFKSRILTLTRKGQIVMERLTS